MLVQPHTVQPADPLETLDEDYESAVLHVAWHESKDDQRTLLFAFVELLPTEVPPPLDDGPQTLELGAGGTSLHLRRIVLPARAALDWYLGCRRGEVALPGPDAELRPVSSVGVDLVRGEDPPWPSLVCPLDRATIPFCPSWHGQPRVHRLVPQAAFPLAALWPEGGVRACATTWLEERLHFSLAEYPELWGSIHLVAPNPVYRAMGSRLRIDAESRESILIRFEPRAGKTVDGLHIGFSEGEPWGALGIAHAEVHGPLLRFDVGRRVSGVKEEVYDPWRGVLSTSKEYLQFVRDFRVQTHVLSKSDRAEDPSIVRARPDASARVTSTRTRMVEAYYGRKDRSRARTQHRVFHGRDDALEGMREQIARAHRDVLIVDPELRSLTDLVDALHDWVHVPLRFLTSASAAVDRLLSEMGVLAAQRAHRRIELRVFDGRVPLEGQFMAVDEQLWAFNVPLHRLGRPGTFMARAPLDDSLREWLAQAWHEAREPGLEAAAS